MRPKLERILFFFDGSVYKMYIHPTFAANGSEWYLEMGWGARILFA